MISTTRELHSNHRTLDEVCRWWLVGLWFGIRKQNTKTKTSQKNTFSLKKKNIKFQLEVISRKLTKSRFEPMTCTTKERYFNHCALALKRWTFVLPQPKN